MFATERPNGMGRYNDSRVYVPDESGIVTGWLSVVRAELSPNGCWVYCAPALQGMKHSVSVDGAREEGMWRWRWWPRSAEDDASELAAYEYEPGEHRGGWVWRNRQEARR